MTEFRTYFVSALDKADWRVLFDDYADFYAVAMNDEIADRVWTWLFDPSHVLEGLITRDSNGLRSGLLMYANARVRWVAMTSDFLTTFSLFQRQGEVVQLMQCLRL